MRSIVDSSGSESIWNDERINGWQVSIELRDEGEGGTVVWAMEHVESIWSIVSGWIILGKDERWVSIGDDKQEQWARDVTVLIIVKRSAI
jgi:hypothetical protein